MIIILNQAQIEQALSDYIHARIVVQDGMQLDIDLKATRGETGMTATIEINPIADAAEAPATEPAPIAKISATKIATPKLSATKVVSAVAAVEEPAAEEAPAEEASEEAAAEPEAPTEPKKSIFAKMKQPTGRVGDGDGVEAA